VPTAYEAHPPSYPGIKLVSWLRMNWVLRCSIPTHEYLRYIALNHGKGKVISFPVQSYYRPTGFQGIEFHRFEDKWHIKVVRLTVPPIGFLYPHEKSVYSFQLVAESTLGHSAVGKIISMKNSNGNIGNGTRNLPACSAVPPRTPLYSCLLTSSCNSLRAVWP